MKKISLYRILMLACIFFVGCNSDNVKGIILGNTLVVHQDYSENRRMVSLIKLSLKRDSEAFKDLINFPNGGGESGYNFGYVITQIIYRIGEDETIRMIRDYEERNMNNLEGYIGVGLEYGDNDYDGKMDNARFNREFSKLYKYIKVRTE